MVQNRNIPQQGDLFSTLATDAPIAGLADEVESEQIVLTELLASAQSREAPIPRSNQSSLINVGSSGASASSLNSSNLDSGDELVHNRRGKVGGSRWSDVADQNDTLKVKTAVKSKIWTKPDYEQLVADGMNPIVAHLVKQCYDSVPTKPIVSSASKIDDAVFQGYFEATEIVRRVVFEWAEDPHVLASVAKMGGRWIGESILSGFDRKQGGSGLSLAARIEDAFAVLPFGLRTLGGRSFTSSVSFGYREVKRAKDAVDKDWPGKRESWQVQGYKVISDVRAEASRFDGNPEKSVVRLGGIYLGVFDSFDAADKYAKGIKQHVLVSKYNRIVDSFDTRDEAIEGARNATKRDKSSTVDEKGTSVVAADRVGVVRRPKNQDITSDQLRDTFGFRGINFGNWMKTSAARTEAQMHLNYAYDSLFDLAEILGLPPKALSFNGMLGLAIGAQGKGGGRGAAHFVPGENEINITRTSGAGFLAHEWGHAFDHYFACQSGLATKKAPYLSEHAGLSMRDGKSSLSDIRQEIVLSFANIVSTFNKREKTREEFYAEHKKQHEKNKSRLERWLVSVKMDFLKIQSSKEIVPHEFFDGISQRILDCQVDTAYVDAGRGNFFLPIVVELRNAYKAEHKRAYSTDQSKGLQSSISAYLRSSKTPEWTPQMTKSNFAEEAEKLDADKGGKPYWSTDLEKFARSFHAFVVDELEAKGASNTYLAKNIDSGLLLPRGDERERINQAFRSLVGLLKTSELESSVQLYSMAGKDEVPKISLSRDRILDVLRGVSACWPKMPECHIIRSAEDAPFDMDSSAKAVYKNGVIWLIEEKIESVNDLKKVLAHEIVFHHSLMDMLGEKKFKAMSRGIQALKQSGNRVICGLADEIRYSHGKLSDLDESAEIIALAGERCLSADGEIKVEFEFIKSIFSNLVEWIRDKGVDIPFSNFEMQGLIVRAAKNAERDSIFEPGACTNALDLSRNNRP